MVFQTDKSGRMAIDSKEGYIKATEPHIINDPIIQENIHVECQKEINAHCTMWIRLLKAGKCTGTSAMSGTNRITK